MGGTQTLDQDFLFGQHGFMSANARKALSLVPGTKTYEVAMLIQSVKDNIGIDTLLNIKREGSGLGQVPQRQLETLMGVLGRLEIQRDPVLLRRDIVDVLTMYQDIIDKAMVDDKTIEGNIPLDETDISGLDNIRESVMNVQPAGLNSILKWLNLK